MIRMHYFIILSCLLFALPGLVTSSGQYSVVNQSHLDNATFILSVPDVQSILGNHTRYLGKTIEVSGIVSKTYPQEHEFTLSDQVGCSLCVAKNARDSITVIYPGKIPKNRETVLISGQLIIDAHKRLIINSTSVTT